MNEKRFISNEELMKENLELKKEIADLKEKIIKYKILLNDETEFLNESRNEASELRDMNIKILSTIRDYIKEGIIPPDILSEIFGDNKKME